MTKEDFLLELESELKKIKHQDSSSIIQYYDELIEDERETGKKEKTIIKNLGPVSEIITNIKKEEEKTKVPKQTISNSIKALIAVLSILSLPFLIPTAIIIFSIIFTVMILMASFIICIIAFMVAAVAVFFGNIYMLITGLLPIYSFVFGTGATLLIFGLLIYALKYTFVFSKSILSWTIEKFNKLLKKRGNKDE